MNLKIAVVDTFNGNWGIDELKKMFPKVKIQSFSAGDIDTKPHPHGYQVASRLLLPLIDTDVELFFIRYVDACQSDADSRLFKIIEDIKPHIINNSWTSPRMGRNLEQFQIRSWASWVAKEKELREKIGYIQIFGAGNTDTNGLSYHDIGYPQRLLQDVIIVGAHDRKGVVMDFSSDGKCLTCCALGHYVYVFNPFELRWQLTSGTSFSAPDVSGLISWLMVYRNLSNYENILEWIKINTTYPVNFENQRPHPKFGWGSVADEFMSITKGLDVYTRVKMPKSIKGKLEYLDFTRLEK